MLHIAAKVRALIFDTPSINSEWKIEAAKSLEEMLGKKVLYHASRHYVYKLVVNSGWK